MSLAKRRSANTDIWPGFVDALATLLMVIIFLLMVFVVSQLLLNDEIVGRDKALNSLNRQIEELADMLNLERTANAGLRNDLDSLSTRLQASLGNQADLRDQINRLENNTQSLTARLAQTESEKTALNQRIAIEIDKNRAAEEAAEAYRLEAEKDLTDLSEKLNRESLVSKDLAAKLEDAYREVDASKETLAVQLEKLVTLEQAIAGLEALKTDLEQQLSQAIFDKDTKDQALEASRAEIVRARAEAALINRQLRALQTQITELSALLEAAENKDRRAQAQIRNLGKRLNAALAQRVQELAQYRSEFFGRLRAILGARSDVQIVGDRFIFQSEVLFDAGSDQFGPDGKQQLSKLARGLQEISGEIPQNINWILQVEGHTDNRPIATSQFPSNWELSTARAISVVKFLIESGIAPARLSATGYGEFQPLAMGEDDVTLRRNRRIELKLTQR